IDGYAFGSCTSLEEIAIPASVTNIAANAFEECTALKTIKGTKGSYAETFAKNNGFTFVEK
ncbi:MAG: leucine-rich repeat protein, partial [Eubacterium sp.]|nr:leucine-rich repeat protein [Eubacterium sp.]